MSERPITTASVAVRERASGRFLATGAAWTDDERRALVIDEAEATALVRRFACERDAIELVALGERGRAVA